MHTVQSSPEKKICLTKKKRAEAILQMIHRLYPDPETHLQARNPWELLIAVILSAQCTDARVNMVTPDLFTQWPDPQSLAQADLTEVETCIRSTGFFRNKAKNIIATAQRIASHYGGLVPDSMNALLTLPGVARKTANVVLWNAFKKNEGIAVDTHVGRIARRTGLTANADPQAVEKDLMRLFPRQEWGNVNHSLVWFGRQVCSARNPQCNACDLDGWCPKNGVGQRR